MASFFSRGSGNNQNGGKAPSKEAAADKAKRQKADVEPTEVKAVFGEKDRSSASVETAGAIGAAVTLANLAGFLRAEQPDAPVTEETSAEQGDVAALTATAEDLPPEDDVASATPLPEVDGSLPDVENVEASQTTSGSTGSGPAQSGASSDDSALSSQDAAITSGASEGPSEPQGTPPETTSKAEANPAPQSTEPATSQETEPASQPTPDGDPRLTGTIEDYSVVISGDRTSVTFTDLRPDSPDGIVEVSVDTTVILDDAPLILRVADTEGGEIAPGSDPELLVGEGETVLRFSDAPEGVTLDLTPGTTGQAGDASGDVQVGAPNIIGSRHDDTVQASSVGSEIDGGAGDDRLTGGLSQDTLTGGSGDDVLAGGADQDVAIFAGDLTDFSVTWDDAAESFTIADLNATDGLDEGRDVVSGVETFRFNGQDYTASELQVEAERQANDAPDAPAIATGGSVAENSGSGQIVATLTANDANGDPLTYMLTDAAGTPVTDPNFEIVGNEIRLAPGADIDFEGAASHTLHVTSSDAFETSAPAPVTIAVQDVAEILSLGDGGVRFTDTSVTEMAVSGGAGDDRIAGSAGSDIIAGQGGDDTLTSGQGADTLSGGAGDDLLHAGTGDDVVMVGAGNDSVNGGAGNDRLEMDADLADLDILYDDATDTFTLTDRNVVDGLDEGQNTVTRVENFRLNGTDYTADDLRVEAERQANTAPDSPRLTSGGTVAEDAVTGYVVATLDPTDPDGDALTYTLTDADGVPVNDSNFEIVGNEIRVKPGADLDFEAVESHTLHVTSSDAFETSAPVDITVSLTDVAEDLVLAADGESFTDRGISERSIRGSGTGADTITGADGADQIHGAGGDDVIATGQGDDLISGDAGNDAIDGGAGQDQANFDGPLGDYTVAYDAATDSFTITDLNAADGLDEGADTVTGVEAFSFDGVLITATDLQTEAARQANTGPGDPSVASGGSVEENSAAGTAVATLDATDPDGDALTYTLTDAGGVPVTDSNFEIVGNEIRVKPGADLDFESADSHVVHVAASDAFETSAPVQMTLSVSDAAEDLTLADGGVTFTDESVAESSVKGGDGDDALRGLAGDNNLQGQGGDDTLTGGDGDDTLSGDAGADHLDGEAGDDTLLGGDGADTLTGGAGADALMGGEDADTLTGGDGGDTLTGDAGADHLDGEADDDILFGGDGDDTLAGGDGADALSGDAGADHLDGEAGDDTLFGGDGADILTGGDGADTLSGDAGADSLDGGAGDDALFGGDGADTLTGGDGADALMGGDDTDTLTGGDGADLLSGDAGADSLDGGADGDTLFGGDGADTLTGGAGDDVLMGGDGGDTILGGAGDDNLSGEDGDDRLSGGAGNDTLTGGDGTDTVSFSGDRADYTITESGGVYTVADTRAGAPEGVDTISGVEVFEFADRTVATGDLFNQDPTDLTASHVSGIALNSDGGNNSYLQVTDAGDILGGLTEMTAEVQFSSTELGTEVRPLISYSDNSGDVFLLYVSGSGADAEIRFEVGSAGRTVSGFDASDLFDGGQHQISFTWDSDGGAWEVFVDGETVGSGAGVRPGFTIRSGGELVLGQEQDTPGGGFAQDQVFEGTYHDVRIFDDVRTAVEIRDGALATLDPSEDGLVANWTMDSLDGSVVDVVGGRDLSVGNVTGAGWIDSVPAEVVTALNGAADGTFVTQITGVDADAGDTLSYTLVDDAGGRFAIDVDTGAITVADGDLLDMSVQVSHDVVIRVSDGRGGSYDETLTIAVDDLIVGTSGDDTLTGTDGSDRILGLDGDDTLTAGDGDDRLYGGEGDDSVDGGDGDDTLFIGGNVEDFSMSYDNASDTFTLTDNNAADGRDDGADQITGIEIFNFNGNHFTADELKAEIELRYNSAPDAPVVSSGGSVDENSTDGTVVATLAATDADGDPVTYTLTDASGDPATDANFEIVGNEIRVKSGADLDFEGADQHVIHVVASDSLESSAPAEITVAVNDIAEVQTLADGGDSFTEAGVTETSVDGGDGDDVITGSAGDDWFEGNGGNDTLIGGEGNDDLAGDAGDDSIDGGEGSDTLEGGGGNDDILGFLGDDMIDGGTGNDTLKGHSGEDTVIGDQGDDQVFGGGGDDTLFGGEGDDFLGGDFGDDSVDGGDGHDLMFYEGALEDFGVSYDDATDTFTITDNNAADGLDEGTDTITGVEVFRFNGENYTADELRQVADYQGEVASHGTVGHWSFGGTSGVAVDSSATGNDGVLRGDTVQGAPGPFAGANAISLDGDADYVEIVDNDAYDLAEGTISIWIQPNSMDDTQAILSRDASGNGDGDFQIWLRDNGSISVRHQQGGDSETLLTEAGVVEIGDWSNITYTWGSEGMQIGIDGQTLALNTVPRSLEGNNEPFTVGADQWKSSDGNTDNLEHFFDGQVSEFVILADRLESEEVADLYFAVRPADDGTTVASAGGTDILYGDIGDDDLSGGTGDDRLKGRGGDDILSGNSGNDVAVFDGDLADFAISKSGSAFIVTDLNTADGDEGTDTVTGAKLFEFGGVTYTDDEIDTEIERRENTAPDSPSVASGGSLDENASDGTVVATLAATDADGDTLSYTLTDAGGTPIADSNFEIVGNEIRVKSGADIDFESADSHTLHVTASDTFEASSPTEVTVTVTDVNEGVIASDDAASVQAPDNTYYFTNFNEFGTVNMSNGDVEILGDTNGQTYADIAVLPDGRIFALDFPASNIVQIDPATGNAISTISSDLPSAANALVATPDGTVYAASNTSTGLYTVDLDTGDATLVGDTGHTSGGDIAEIDGKLYLANTSNEVVFLDIDNIDGGGNIPTTHLATGVSPGEMIFGLSTNGDGELFAIDTANVLFTIDVDTGATTVIDNVDADLSSDTIGLAARTETGGVTSGNLLANDADPDGDTLSVTGADVDGTPITVGSDVATDHGTLVLASDGSYTFTLDPDAPAVTALAEGETATQEVTYTVSDGNGTTDTATLTLTITGSNDRPVITSNGGGAAAAITVAENSSAVTTVTSGDADNGDTASFAISGGVDAAFFTIDPTTGDLSFTAPPSFETANDQDGDNTYEVEVSVTDSAGATDTQVLSVTVGDEAEVVVLSASGEDFTDTGVKELFVRGDGNGDDTITGTEGNDRVDGWGGDDTITGLGGDDTLHAGDGHDTVYGGDGDDFISTLWGDDSVDGGDGTDTFSTRGVLSDFEVTYDAGSDTFTLTDLNSGDADGDMGTDVITGVESFTFSDDRTYTSAELQAEAARQANEDPTAPTVASGGNVAENSAAATVVATLASTDAEGDAITYQLTDAGGAPVADSNFEIVGNEVRVKTGADIDFEAAESHTLHVTASDALGTSDPTEITVTVDDVAETVLLDAAGETFVDRGVAELVVGGGQGGSDTITGLDDDNHFHGQQGDDFLFGGGGNDSLSGDGGNDNLSGDDGDDIVTGGDGDDTLFGGAGNDSLWGSDGNDQLFGGDGDDGLEGRRGDDTLFGGAGHDTFKSLSKLENFEVTYDFKTDTFTLADQTIDPAASMGTDVATGFETFTFYDGDFSAFDAIKTAHEMRLLAEDNPDNDHLGASGSQTLTGSGADDTFHGGADDDSLNGQGGEDTLSGGSGADTINAGLDDDVVYGGSGADLVFGGDGADVIYGDGGDDSIVAGAGDDFVMGGSGADTIEGGDGADVIIGGTGNDVIDGGDGADLLRVGAGEGDDTFEGGVGGGWTDIIALEDVAGPISVSGGTVTGDGWTMTLDVGSSVVAQDTNQLDLSEDAAGTILFDAGGSIDFQGVEAVTW